MTHSRFPARSKWRLLVVSLCFLILWGGCAVENSLVTPEELLLSVPSEEAPSAEALRRGRATVMRSCAECHRVYFPQEFRSRRWKEILPVMAEKAGLSTRQEADLELYVLTASRASFSKPPSSDSR